MSSAEIVPCSSSAVVGSLSPERAGPASYSFPSLGLTFASRTHSESEMKPDLQGSQQLVPMFLLGLDSSEGGALVEKRDRACT